MLTLDGGAVPGRRGAVRRALGFVRPYIFGAGAAIYLFALGWTRWRHRAAIVDLCRHFGYRYDAREPTELPVASASAIAPSGTVLEIREIDAVDGNVSERELITICRLVRASSPAELFEFGTFDGRTTLNLAVNAPAGARVRTLDLPREYVGSSVAPIHSHEVQYADKDVSGARFLGSDAASRIVQLFGDSGSFDFAPYYGIMDFVFVDASHTYEYVINDSLHALRMLREGRGNIVWHDYSRWDGVTRGLNELRRLHPAFRGLSWIEGTTLARLHA